jgi:hypothetical protein
MDDDRRPLAEDVEILVGDEARDLEDHAAAHAEACRLEIDPDEVT